MKYTAYHLLCFLLVLSSSLALAESNKAYDVFTNKEYSYERKYKELKDFEINLNGSIDVEYFAMRNEQGNMYDELNAGIENIALHEWKEKQKKFELNNALKLQIAAYNNFINRSNDRYSRGIDNDLNAALVSIDMKILSVCNNLVTFVQSYSFRINSGNYRQNNVEIDIGNYYTANLFSQEINILHATFSDAQIKEAKEILMPVIKAYFSERQQTNQNRQHEAYNEDDEEEKQVRNTGKNNQHTNNSTPKIDLSEASIYWIAWGLILRFPAYSQSTYENNGEAFTVFVPLDQCRALLGDIPAYQSFKQLVKPDHRFTNFNYFEMLSEYQKFRYEPAVTSLFKLNNVTVKPKILTASSYQLFKNNQKNFRGDFVYEFNTKANNYQQEASKSIYTYYLENNNGKSTKRINEALLEKPLRYFDEKGNLILQKSTEAFTGNDYHYFYNATVCYTLNMGNESYPGNEALSKNSFVNNCLCLPDVCLTFDENMQVSAVKMLKYQHNDIELGFDEKGRLVEAHTENDRYNYYYEYDAYDRLRVYSVYEYQRVQKEVVFLYQQEERLPYLQQKHTYNNDIFEEEIYRWEY
ncbi:MAG: hypothetical protein ACK5P4_12095 [Bacteroidota bacterium]